MKSILFALMLVVVAAQVPNLRHPCAGALHAAAAQEKRLPAGEWCQRPAPGMLPKAHACSCHAHDCTKDPSDDNNRSAHTDSTCLVFCDVKNCQCEKMDCP